MRLFGYFSALAAITVVMLLLSAIFVGMKWSPVAQQVFNTIAVATVSVATFWGLYVQLNLNAAVSMVVSKLPA